MAKDVEHFLKCLSAILDFSVASFLFRSVLHFLDCIIRISQALFADDIIVYIINTKNSTKEVLQLISTFSNVSEYKINTHKKKPKTVALLYMGNK